MIKPSSMQRKHHLLALMPGLDLRPRLLMLVCALSVPKGSCARGGNLPVKQALAPSTYGKARLELTKRYT